MEYIHDEADFTDVVLRHQISEIVFLFSPKIIGTMKNVALGDEKDGQTLIVVSEHSEIAFYEPDLNTKYSVRSAVVN